MEVEFDFLLQNGFQMTKFIRPPEEEYVFCKDDCAIEIDITGPYGFFEKYHREIDVILTIGDIRKNVLDWESLFGDDKLCELRETLSLQNQDQLAIYSEFLKNNLAKYA